jgi:Bacterial type II and III secretion system protein
MTHRVLILLCALLLAESSVLAQDNRERRLYLNDYVSPEELVSMSSTLPFDKAVLLFSDFSKKYLNKIIVDPTNTTKPIGVDIHSMYWLQAFETVLRANSLWYTEKEEYFQVYNPQDSAKALAKASAVEGFGQDTTARALLHSRDVKISAVFFSIDVTKSLNTGINWSFMYYGDTTAIGNKPTQFGAQNVNNLVNPNQSSSGTGTTGTTTQPEGFLGTVIPYLKFSTVTAFASFLEGNGLGDIISSPEIIVTSGKTGRMQVGTDIFLTTKDFAGNTIQTPLSTGIIVQVTPTVYQVEKTRFINLDISVEDSKANGTTSVDKSSVKTYLVLADSEETVLGGLYSNTTDVTREGIPLLKDLPWWFFGLRYIFGSEVSSEEKDELIILLRAEVVPTIEERIAAKLQENQQNLIEKTRKEFDEDMAKHKPKE